LFFLDYFACGRLDTDLAAAVIDGIAEGCVQAGAALIGGETAEMPDMYPAGEYDLAGFCVGVVERAELIDGSAITHDDVVIGMGSSGPHSNGFSLIRRILQTVDDPVIDGSPAALLLLAPTRIYARAVLGLMQKITVKGLAHITGGGITDNLPRTVPADLHAEIDVNTWRQGAVFDWLAETGQIAADEMRRTFNCGVGMALVVAPGDAGAALGLLETFGEKAWRMGRIARGSGGVRYV
jgi:phosphoribosylformylglycinamidine cyclo-ligase